MSVRYETTVAFRGSFFSSSRRHDRQTRPRAIGRHSNLKTKKKKMIEKIRVRPLPRCVYTSYIVTRDRPSRKRESLIDKWRRETIDVGPCVYVHTDPRTCEENHNGTCYRYCNVCVQFVCRWPAGIVHNRNKTLHGSRFFIFHLLLFLIIIKSMEIQ